VGLGGVPKGTAIYTKNQVTSKKVGHFSFPRFPAVFRMGVQLGFLRCPQYVDVENRTVDEGTPARNASRGGQRFNSSHLPLEPFGVFEEPNRQEIPRRDWAPATRKCPRARVQATSSRWRSTVVDLFEISLVADILNAFLRRVIFGCPPARWCSPKPTLVEKALNGKVRRLF
jgi:hypothetical protein